MSTKNNHSMQYMQVKIQTPAMMRLARDTVHTVWAFIGWQIAMYLHRIVYISQSAPLCLYFWCLSFGVGVNRHRRVCVGKILKIPNRNVKS